MATRIRIRRDTAAIWATVNPIPSLGEFCYETDTGVLKIGDGTIAYNSLPEVGAGVSTANVTAAGALMDTEVDPDIKTLVLPANTTISPFAAGLLDDLDAVAARSTLGLGAATTAKTYAARKLTARFDPLRLGAVAPGGIVGVLSENFAATSIVGGVRIPFKKLNATYIDTVNDPHFNHTVPQTSVQISAGDMSMPDLVTGGGAQFRRWVHSFGFMYSGQKVGFYVRAASSSTWLWQLYVNGLPISALPTMSTLASSGRYHLEFDFGSAVQRMIDFRQTGVGQMGGIFIEPTASVAKAPARPRLVVMGDSISGGASGVNVPATWTARLADAFDMEDWNIAIGGTGYNAGSPTSSFADRAVDFVRSEPDLMVLAGGYNDALTAIGTVIAKIEETLNEVQAALPDVPLVIVGCHAPSHTPSSGMFAVDDALRAAAVARGLPFISMQDPDDLRASTPAWAAGVAYVVGDLRKAGNTVFVCRVAHTSSVSINLTNFVALSFITGTGKVGAPVGDGNADIFIQADGVHLTQVGQNALGSRLAWSMVEALEAIAG